MTFRSLMCRVGWHRWWKTNYYERACTACDKKQIWLAPDPNNFGYYGWFDVN